MEVYSWGVTILVLFITLLATNISRIRFKEKVGLGDGGKLSLKKATRAHINTLEHTIPFCLIAYVLSSNDTSSIILTAIFAVFLFSRFLHAYSYYISSDITRQLSAGLTYLCIFTAVCLSLIKLA
jgi:uncharacterized membrane protein YecN with MAPEG domain